MSVDVVGGSTLRHSLCCRERPGQDRVRFGFLTIAFPSVRDGVHQEPQKEEAEDAGNNGCDENADLGVVDPAGAPSPVKARSVMNSETVKPIPASSRHPRHVLQGRALGRSSEPGSRGERTTSRRCRRTCRRAGPGRSPSSPGSSGRPERLRVEPTPALARANSGRIR